MLAKKTITGNSPNKHTLLHEPWPQHPPANKKEMRLPAKVINEITEYKETAITERASTDAAVLLAAESHRTYVPLHPITNILLVLKF